MVLRTEAGEGEALSALRGIVRGLDPAVPTYREGSLQRLVDEGSARARTVAAVLMAASGVTLLLAAVGLYGITAYSVALRRRELGIRMAIGAGSRDVTRLVSLLGVRLAAAGIAIGLMGTVATSQLLRSLLYGVSPMDPVTLALTPLLVFALAVVATWIAARQAAAISPGEALRSQ